MKIMVTGHRPNKLFGYSINAPQYRLMRESFKKFCLTEQQKNPSHPLEMISGMALGVDMQFALSAIELKAAGYQVILHCAIPCQNHTSKWFDRETIGTYNWILQNADITHIPDIPYSPKAMQERNEYMVNHTDICLAIWDGTPGGTANCVNYAVRTGKPVMYLYPSMFRDAC